VEKLAKSKHKLSKYKLIQEKKSESNNKFQPKYKPKVKLIFVLESYDFWFSN